MTTHVKVSESPNKKIIISYWFFAKKILPVDSSPQNSTTRVTLTTRAISFGGQHLKFLNFHGECLGDGWYWSTMIMKKEKQKLAFNFWAMRKYSDKKLKFSALTLSDSHLILNKISTESESQLSLEPRDPTRDDWMRPSVYYWLISE